MESKTAEAVVPARARSATPLKRGVNEKGGGVGIGLAVRWRPLVTERLASGFRGSVVSSGAMDTLGSNRFQPVLTGVNRLN
jgi:hypothetical protein